MSLGPPEARNPAHNIAAQRSLRLLLFKPPALQSVRDVKPEPALRFMGARAACRADAGGSVTARPLILALQNAKSAAPTSRRTEFAGRRNAHTVSPRLTTPLPMCFPHNRLHFLPLSPFAVSPIPLLSTCTSLFVHRTDPLKPTMKSTVSSRTSLFAHGTPAESDNEEHCFLRVQACLYTERRLKPTMKSTAFCAYKPVCIRNAS